MSIGTEVAVCHFEVEAVDSPNENIKLLRDMGGRYLALISRDSMPGCFKVNDEFFNGFTSGPMRFSYEVGSGRLFCIYPL